MATPTEQIISKVFSGLTDTWYKIRQYGVKVILEKERNGEMARVPWIVVYYDDGRTVEIPTRHCEIHRRNADADDDDLPF